MTQLIEMLSYEHSTATVSFNDFGMLMRLVRTLRHKDKLRLPKQGYFRMHESFTL